MYTDEEALETIRWFFKVLIPALDKNARVRVNATPLSAQSLPMVLARDRDWVTKTYPIEYRGEQAERKATWPGRYPLDWITLKKIRWSAWSPRRLHAGVHVRSRGPKN